MTHLIVADAVVTGGGTQGNGILVENGMVAAVGPDHELRSGADTISEYSGAFIVPGFRDAHIHIVPYTELLSGCSLKSATSMDDLVSRLRHHADRVPAPQPVVAWRMDDETLSERRLPTRHDLDRAVADRPAVVYRYCGHIAVANTAALDMSGVTPATPDPEGGIVDRDAHGVPTGVLRETASGLIADAMTRGGTATEDSLVNALHRLAGLGITSVGAMIGYGEDPMAKLAAESELLRSVTDRLPIRVGAFSIAPSTEGLTASKETLESSLDGDRLRWLGVKRFADGSLGGHTAAMSSPFSDVDTCGTMRLTDEDRDLARHALSLGGMVAIHAIGDHAVAKVLDLFDGLIAAGADPSDLRMEHVSVAGPELLDRFAATGVAAIVQPPFLASEAEWLPKRLDDERLAWAYPFRSMLARGIPVAGSSDSVVEPPNPLWGIAAAMDRYGINPAEALTGTEALHLYTAAAARALREPVPLAIGSPADLAVIDTDIRSADAAGVHDTIVLETFVDGVPVEVDRSLPTWVD